MFIIKIDSIYPILFIIMTSDVSIGLKRKEYEGNG